MVPSSQKLKLLCVVFAFFFFFLHPKENTGNHEGQVSCDRDRRGNKFVQMGTSVEQEFSV